MIEPADRGDFRVAFAAGEQGRRRIDQLGIDAQDFPGAIRHHADGTAAHRQHHDLAALPRDRRRRHPKQRAQRDQRQQAVAQRNDAQHGRFRTRHLRDLRPAAE